MALRIPQIALNFFITFYSAALAYYLAFGPVDFRLADHFAGAPQWRIILGGVGKPGLILLLAAALRYGLSFIHPSIAERPAAGPLGRLENEFGLPILTLSAAISIYLLTINVIIPWKRPLGAMAQFLSHRKLLAEAAAAIPPGPVVYATSGAYFEGLNARPGTKILAGVDAALVEAGSGAVYFLVDTYLGQSRKAKEALDLMLRPDYHLVYYKKDIYLFALGAKGELDRHAYAADFLTFEAAETDNQVGGPWPDPFAPAGYVRKAAAGKDKPGFMAYGHYISLKKGRHEAVFRLKVSSGTPDEVAELDVAADEGKIIVAKRRIRGTDFKTENEWDEMRFSFDIAAERVDNIQLRVTYLGGADLYFSRLWAEPNKETFGK